MQTHHKIFVAGHAGLAGSAIVRALRAQGFANLLLRRRSELDLRNRDAVMDFFRHERPDHVFLAAAKVGGILANHGSPADFLLENLAIQNNVIEAAFVSRVRKLLFLGSSCIYPRDCPQPIKEEYLLTGPLESTNEAYAIAKIAGIKLCASFNRQYGTDFISAMPTNLYGPGDNYDLQTSHVLPALIRKLHEATVRGESRVTVWGSGAPRREFLYSDDLGSAAVFLMQDGRDRNFGEIINVGCGEDITIRELAGRIAAVVGFRGELVFDTGKPDGTPRKLLDVSRLRALGWQASVALEQGLRRTYAAYLQLPQATVPKREEEKKHDSLVFE
ncbi:MAG: GDP-L-fucose synthase family protein [Burkholderiales bacterium]